MAWIEAPSASGSAVMNDVGWTTRRLFNGLWSAISWRIGPSCMVMIGSMESARNGVAVRPIHRPTAAARIAASDAGAPTQWHSSTMTRP